MATPSRGLGKGLDALLKGFNEVAHDAEVKTIPIASIVPNPFQPRKEFSEQALTDLADSIRAQGVLQPILVRNAPDSSPGHFELVAGERRLRAAKLAGLQEIPCLVRALDDDQSLTIAIVENLQREDLNPVEEAHGLKQLQDRLQLSQEELAQRVGKSRPAIANTLRLLQLPSDILDAVRLGDITAGHGRALLALDDSDAMMELFEIVRTEQPTVRDVEKLVTHWKEHGEFPALSAARNKRPPRLKTPTAKDASLQSLGKQLKSTLDLRVSVKGSMETGSIAFKYNSREQLKALMQRLGVEHAE